MRRLLLKALALAPLAAWAQSAPLPNADLAFLDKGPLRLVVPFAAGGGVDTVARLVARQLQADTGIAVIVDNRAGGNGSIGGRAVQQAEPDGKTLLFSAATHVLTNLVMDNPPYDPLADFAPVARVGEAPLLMVIAPDLPQKNLAEVLQAMKQHPEQWAAAVPALGAPSHIGTLLLFQQGGVKVDTVAYKGTTPALNDVAGGHTQVLIDSIVSLMPMVKSGKLKAVAVASPERSSIAPDVPSVAESGYPGLAHTSWYGIWGPKDLPQQRQLALNQAINHAVSQLAKSGAWEPLGIQPVMETAAQLQQFAADDVRKSAELLKTSGYRP